MTKYIINFDIHKPPVDGLPPRLYYDDLNLPRDDRNWLRHELSRRFKIVGGSIPVEEPIYFELPPHLERYSWADAITFAEREIELAANHFLGDDPIFNKPNGNTFRAIRVVGVEAESRSEDVEHLLESLVTE